MRTLLRPGRPYLELPMAGPRRADHERAAQGCLEAALNRVREKLATVHVRPAIKPVYRHADDGPYASEVSVLMWKDGNVVDALVFPAWGDGGAVSVVELDRMIEQELEAFVEEQLAQRCRGRWPAQLGLGLDQVIGAPTSAKYQPARAMSVVARQRPTPRGPSHRRTVRQSAVPPR